MLENSNRIKAELLNELRQKNLFWSFPKRNIDNISDDQLIEKVLIYSELDEIYQLFKVYPKSHIRKVWEQRLIPNDRLYSLNKLFAFLFFDIEEPGVFLKHKQNSFIKS